MAFYLIILLSVLSPSLSSINFEYIISIDNKQFNKNSISFATETEEIIDSFHYGKSGQVGFPVLTNLNSDLIFGDQFRPINLELETNNGEIGSDIVELLYIKKKSGSRKKLLQNYRLNVNISENVISSIDKRVNNKTYGNSKDKEYITCNYRINQGGIDIGKDTYNINQYNKIAQYSFLVIGLKKDEGNLYIISNQNNTYHNSKIFEPSPFSIEDVFIVHQSNLNYPYLAIVSYSLKLMNIYKLIINTDNMTYKLSEHDINVVLNTNNQINKIGMISTHNYMINYVNSNTMYSIYNDMSWKSNVISYEASSSRVIDFIILNYTVYIMYESYGIAMYKYSINENNATLKYVNSIKQQNVLYMDYYINPFYSSTYLGIQLSSNIHCRKDCDSEFFIEFLLFDEETPILNKIFTSKNSIIDSYSKMLTLDLFFSYFYNSKTNAITIIRRGMLNSIPYLTYTYPLQSQLTNEYHLTSFADYSKKVSYIALYSTSSDDYLKISNFYLPSHSIECEFPNEGEYAISFVQRAEICGNSMNSISKENQYVMCQKIIDYNYKIYLSTNTHFINQFLICLSLVIVVMFISILVFFCKTEKCKKRKMLIVKVSEREKNEFDRLYNEEEVDVTDSNSEEKKSEQSDIVSVPSTQSMKYDIVKKTTSAFDNVLNINVEKPYTHASLRSSEIELNQYVTSQKDNNDK